MDQTPALAERQAASSNRAQATAGTPPRAVLELPSIGRFLLGSFLLMPGCLLILSAPITVVGLPLGLMVLAAGLDLMLAPRNRRTRTQEA
jgi:hypothetical protein